MSYSIFNVFSNPKRTGRKNLFWAEMGRNLKVKFLKNAVFCILLHLMNDFGPSDMALKMLLSLVNPFLVHSKAFLCFKHHPSKDWVGRNHIRSQDRPQNHQKCFKMYIQLSFVFFEKVRSTPSISARSNGPKCSSVVLQEHFSAHSMALNTCF